MSEQGQACGCAFSREHRGKVMEAESVLFDLAVLSGDLPPARPTAHTPGPWELDPEIVPNDYGGVQRDGSRALLRRYVRHAGPLGGRICECFRNCLVTSDEELIANARLIAAAPKLLKALQALVKKRDSYDEHARLLFLDKQIDAARTAIEKATGAKP